MTAISIGVHSRIGLVGFSGPAGITFAKPTLVDYSWDQLARTIIEPTATCKITASAECSDNPWFDHKEKVMLFEPTPPWSALLPGRCRGRCVAGNLGTMLLLAGTPFWPELEGAVLVVEEDEAETPETIDRLFTQLRQMGVFDKIAGLAVGRMPRAVGFTEQDTLESLLRHALRGYSFPVLANVDYGHTDPLMTLPIGIEIELDADAGSIVLLEPAVT